MCFQCCLWEIINFSFLGFRNSVVKTYCFRCVFYYYSYYYSFSLHQKCIIALSSTKPGGVITHTPKRILLHNWWVTFSRWPTGSERGFRILAHSTFISWRISNLFFALHRGDSAASQVCDPFLPIFTNKKVISCQSWLRRQFHDFFFFKGESIFTNELRQTHTCYSNFTYRNLYICS